MTSDTLEIILNYCCDDSITENCKNILSNIYNDKINRKSIYRLWFDKQANLAYVCKYKFRNQWFFFQSNLMVIRSSYFFFSGFKPAMWFMYGVVGPLHWTRSISHRSSKLLYLNTDGDLPGGMGIFILKRIWSQVLLNNSLYSLNS